MCCRGAFSRPGDHVRITVTLTSARDGCDSVGSAHTIKPLKDVSTVQDSDRAPRRDRVAGHARRRCRNDALCAEKRTDPEAHALYFGRDCINGIVAQAQTLRQAISPSTRPCNSIRTRARYAGSVWLTCPAFVYDDVPTDSIPSQSDRCGEPRPRSRRPRSRKRASCSGTRTA